MSYQPYEGTPRPQPLGCLLTLFGFAIIGLVCSGVWLAIMYIGAIFAGVIE